MHNVEQEITKLVAEITRLGHPSSTGKYGVKFGVLVRDDRCADIFEGLVGTLKAAKKRKIVDFRAEVLLQGVSDDVDVVIL